MAKDAPNIDPIPRELGTRVVTHKLGDGRTRTETVTDICYDIPLDLQCERACQLNPDFLRDLLRPPELGTGDSWSDIQHGSVYSENPYVWMPGQNGKEGPALGDCSVGWLFYYDGLGINNPIGPWHNNHNLGMCYAMAVNLSPCHRLSLHNVFLVTVAQTTAYSNWPASHLVYGQLSDPDTSASFGKCMERFAQPGGVKCNVPDPNSVTGCSILRVAGGCIGVTADTPAAGWLMGTKESYGPDVKQFCRLCDACQVCSDVTSSSDFGQLYPARTTNSFLDWTNAGENVWTLRDDDSHNNLRQKCAGLAGTAVVAELTAHGYNTLDHAFINVPGVSAHDAPQDAMHIEEEGNLKIHIPAFTYMLTTHFGVALDVINDRIRSCNFGSSRSDTPPEFRDTVKKGTINGTPADDVSLGWSATQVHYFAMHALEIFGPLITPAMEQHAVWLCFKQHIQYYMLLQQTKFTKNDVAQLDQLIFSQQTLFLSIPHYFSLWRPKNHFAQHFPVDILRYGPPVYYKCLKFEMRHQLIKKIARGCNFKNVEHTVAHNFDMHTALDLKEGRYYLLLTTYYSLLTIHYLLLTTYYLLLTTYYLLLTTYYLLHVPTTNY